MRSGSRIAWFMSSVLLLIGIISTRINGVLCFTSPGLTISSHRAISTKRQRSRFRALFLKVAESKEFSNKDDKTLQLNNDRTYLGSLEVPQIGIGTISWSSESLLSMENKRIETLVASAYEANAAFFDTAERYGTNYKAALGMGWGETEQLTRLFLDRAMKATTSSSSLSRSAPIVATKFTPTPWRATPESVVEACKQSCDRLGVEQLDLYQLHMPDIIQPLRIIGKGQTKDEIYWEGLAECFHRGLVKNVGVCNYGPTLMKRCQEALGKRGVPLSSNQIAFSLIGRQNGAQETLDVCNELGIKVLAFFPFAMGLLTGKYSSLSRQKDPQQDKIQLSGSALSLSTSQKTRLEMLDLKRYAQGDGTTVPRGGIAPLLGIMENIAEERGKSVAQVALNYIICKGAIPIPGARTKEQLMDNLGAMGWRLTACEVALLEQTADSLGFGFEGAGFKRTSEKFVGYGVEKWKLD